MKNFFVSAATCIALHIGWYYPITSLIIISIVFWIACGVYVEKLYCRAFNMEAENHPILLLGPIYFFFVMVEDAEAKKLFIEDFQNLFGYSVSFHAPIKLQKIIKLNNPDSVI